MAALSDGATILAPVVQAPRGDSLGVLSDRFGVTWLVTIAGSARLLSAPRSPQPGERCRPRSVPSGSGAERPAGRHRQGSTRGCAVQSLRMTDPAAAPLNTSPDHRSGDVVHIVLFRFRDSTTTADRGEVARRFHALAGGRRDGRPYIRSIRSGSQISPEGAGHGFELGFVVEFASEGDRNHYLGRPFVGDSDFDPDHDAFKQFVAPLLAPGGAGVLVFDLHADAHAARRE